MILPHLAIDVVIVAAILAIHRWIYPLFLVTVKIGTNPRSTAAKKSFLDVLEAAKKEVIIHDDGDRVSDSPYEDDEVLAKMRAVCDRGVAIRCLFNCDEDLAIKRELANVVGIRIRKYRNLGAHYKIADGGALAYLSWHRPGEVRRTFRRIDCRAVPKYALTQTKDRLLGEYIEAFKDAYENAAHQLPASAAR